MFHVMHINWTDSFTALQADNRIQNNGKLSGTIIAYR